MKTRLFLREIQKLVMSVLDRYVGTLDKGLSTTYAQWAGVRQTHA